MVSIDHWLSIENWWFWIDKRRQILIREVRCSTQTKKTKKTKKKLRPFRCRNGAEGAGFDWFSIDFPFRIEDQYPFSIYFLYRSSIRPVENESTTSTDSRATFGPSLPHRSVFNRRILIAYSGILISWSEILIVYQNNVDLIIKTGLRPAAAPPGQPGTEPGIPVLLQVWGRLAGVLGQPGVHAPRLLGLLPTRATDAPCDRPRLCPVLRSAAYCTFNDHLFLQFSIENAERWENFPWKWWSFSFEKTGIYCAIGSGPGERVRCRGPSLD